MKRYFSLLLIIVLFGIMFIPSVFADNKVGIKSIELVEKSENTTINSEPKFNNLEMNLDVAFKAKDDYVKYKVVVSNNTDIDYKISEDTSFNDSQYMNYKYEVNDELKANDETVVYVTITYSKEIDSSKLSNGKYSESNQAIVHLLNSKGEVVNPNTSSSIVIILINLFLVLFISVLLFIKVRNKKAISLALILGLSLIPITTYAVATLKLTINVNVEIEKGYEVDYLTETDIYLTDDELKYWDMSNATCDKTLNIVDGSNITKYTYCDGTIIYKDSNSYFAGDIVELKSLKLRGFDLGAHDPSINMYEYCSNSFNDSVVTCDSRAEEIIYDFDYWDYSKKDSIKYNYPFFDTDKDIMNFSSIKYDNWNEYNIVSLQTPVSFTMPDHDVLFCIFLG